MENKGYLTTEGQGYQQTPPSYSQRAPAVATGSGYPQPHYGTPGVVYATSTQPLIINQMPESFTGQIILSCFVFWCCGWLFGLIAFVLAMMASNAGPREAESAHRMGRASYWVSLAGIIVGCIIIAIVVGITVSNAKKHICYTSVCADYTCSSYTAQLSYC